MGLEEILFTIASLDGLGLAARGLDCLTHFFNFAMGLMEEEVKRTHEKQKLELKVKVKELNVRNNEHKFI